MDNAPVENAPCLTTVQHSEISPHPLSVQSNAQQRLHAGVQPERRQVIDAFLESEKPALVKRASKMGMCGVSPAVRLEAGRRPVLCPGLCRDRICPLCSRLRAQKVRHRVKGLVLKSDSLRFMTLTIPRDDSPMGCRIDKLLKCFAMLRRREFWKQRQKGGLFVVETTRGAKGDHWHVHLHCLIDGDYMDARALKAEWSAVVGSEAILDIRLVKSREKAIAYVCKYISKGSDISKWSGETLCDYAEGVHRRRLFGTFGKWHKIDVNEDRERDEPKELPRHGTTWAKLKEAMDAGTLDRQETVTALWPLGYVWRLLLLEEAGGELQDAVVPGALAYLPLTRVLLFAENVPEREQGPPPPMEIPERGTTASLWPTTKYV